MVLLRLPGADLPRLPPLRRLARRLLRHRQRELGGLRLRPHQHARRRDGAADAALRSLRPAGLRLPVRHPGRSRRRRRAARRIARSHHAPRRRGGAQQLHQQPDHRSPRDLRLHRRLRHPGELDPRPAPRRGHHRLQLVDRSTTPPSTRCPSRAPSSRLDPIREVVLNRLQYRNFGIPRVAGRRAPDQRSTPTSTRSDVSAALRWFELRRNRRRLERLPGRHLRHRRHRREPLRRLQSPWTSRATSHSGTAYTNVSAADADLPEPALHRPALERHGRRHDPDRDPAGHRLRNRQRPLGRLRRHDRRPRGRLHLLVHLRVPERRQLGDPDHELPVSTPAVATSPSAR